MNQGIKNSTSFAELRKRAEQVARERKFAYKCVENLTADVVEKQLYELTLRQIELELQHEDLSRTQLELEASHKRYFDLFNYAPFGYVALCANGQITEINDTGASLFGRKVDEITGSQLTRFLAREDQDVYYLHQKKLRNGSGAVSCELRLVKPDNTCVWVCIETALVPPCESEASAECRLVITDISKSRQEEELRRELEQQVKGRAAQLQVINDRLAEEVARSEKAVFTLRESEEYFRLIVEHLPVAFFCQGQSGIVFANKEASELLKAENSKTLTGSFIEDYLPPEYKALFTEHMDQTLHKRSPQSVTVQMESMRDSLVDVELFLTPFVYRSEAAVQIIAYNITRRKKTEEDISKADKLELIRTIAGGIAHDFNNYLTVLLGNITLAIGNRHNPDKIHQHLLEMKTAIQHTTILSNQLFTFAKGSKPVKETVQLEALIVENSNFALAGSNVRSEFDFALKLNKVEVDQAQITQVLYNIVLNAVQAMPGGGNIFISGANTELYEDREFDGYVLRRGQYVTISITDQGPGIPEKDLSRIFTPFFTTKDAGTGLGLAAAYAIVLNHDGIIEALSPPGEGATFRIYIPASLELSTDEIVREDIIPGVGKILVIDDEEAVRKVIGDMLLHLGYNVFLTREGHEAIEAYRQAREQGEPFELVIMDLTIQGGLGGRETIGQLLQIDPSVKAIVSSGYSNDPVMANFGDYGFMGVVRKPYSVEKLSRAIYEVMQVN